MPISKVKIFVYRGRQQWWWQQRGYDNSSQNIYITFWQIKNNTIHYVHRLQTYYPCYNVLSLVKGCLSYDTVRFLCFTLMKVGWQIFKSVEVRVIVSLKVNFKGNTVVPWIILPLESNYSVTQLCEKLFSGELSDDKDIKLPTHMNPTKNK